MPDARYQVDREAANAAEVDRSIPFIDPHFHVWELERFTYHWLTDNTGPHTGVLGPYGMIRVDWPMERMVREWYGSNVIKTVHVEADYNGPDPVEETVWLDGIADVYGYPHGLVVYCDIEQPGSEALLERHLAASERVRGIRIRSHPDDPDTAAFRQGYAALGKHGLSYELNASPGKLLSGRDTARQFPDVQMILGHAGFPTQRDDDYFGWWRSEIRELAQAPNVACKVSGLGMIDHAWTIDSIRPWVMHCIDAFGPDRTMFATNWPVCVLYGSYLRQVDAYRLILAREGFDREDQEKMLYQNAERFYRI
jgi:predicted TIM-barrel fold metal-dependent hydrolase